MKRTSTRLAAAGMIAGILLLTACGSDSNDSKSTDAPAATEAMTDSKGTEAMTDSKGTEAMTSGTDAMADAGTIVDVAVANGSFTTLVAAVKAAGLAETLSGTGPFTVFAPTDAAFKALPAGLVDCLLLPANKDALTKILTYHVVSGAVKSTDLTAGDVPTVEGGTVAVTLNPVKINDATVVTADVEASNGVIHVIDKVLVPSDVDPAALVCK